MAVSTAVDTRGYKPYPVCITPAFAQQHFMVNILTSAIHAFGVHLPSRTLAFHSILMLTAIFLHLVFMLIGAGGFGVGHKTS
jgi:hypothetical protein